MEDITRLGLLLPRFITEMLVAIVCGGIIGLEAGMRRAAGRQHPTGLRDNILVCLGTVLYMIVSELVVLNAGEGVSSDPSRVAAHIVTAMGFIGAGIIIQQRGGMEGLTSAATIWVVAAIGLVIGAGYPLLGMLITGATLLTLTILHGIERHLYKRPRPLLLKLTVREDSPEVRRILQELLERHKVYPESLRAEKGVEGVKLTVQAPEEPEDIRRLTTDLWTLKGVTEVEH